VVPFTGIEAVQRRSTFLYPIGLSVRVHGKEYLFYSFLYRTREAAMALLQARCKAWKWSACARCTPASQRLQLHCES
jgi:hypothetical protein